VARRLILDTGVLVATERGRAALGEVIDADDDLVIAAITVAELRTGIELADELRRASRTEFLVRTLETLPIEPYDLSVAEAHTAD
jgi:tRNA(fMet)-specific endonuclease VapC